MNRILSGLIFFIWVAGASFFQAFAQPELPIVNVFAPTNSVPEGTNYFSAGDRGYFIFTSSQTNGVNLNVEFSGTATRADFYQVTQVYPPQSFSNFPTNLSIDPWTDSVTLNLRTAGDKYLEGTETLKVKILPDVGYTVGPTSEASIDILDRTQFGPTATNFYFSLGPSNIAQAPSLSFPVTVFGPFETLLIRLLVDNMIVDEFASSKAFVGGESTNVTLTWTNPEVGPHMVSVVSYNETGGSLQRGPFNFNVVTAVLSPAKAFALRSPSGQFNGTNVIVSRSQNNTEIIGAIEFDIPASATNLNGVINFQRGGFSPVVDRLDVFAYAAGPTNGADILMMPREFVGAIETNVGSNIEMDVSPWIQKFAGRKIGIIFAMGDVIPFSYSQYGFSKFTITLNPSGVLDAGPHIHLIGQLPKLSETNEVKIQAEISDPDSAIFRVYLLENNYVIAVDAPSMPYPPGTNVVNFTVELPPGPHVLSVRAASLGKAALSEQIGFYIYSDQNASEHRWLGSQNNSASFYVIDAAGRAHVWGKNERGQLGLGFTNSIAEYGIKRPVTLLPPDGLKFRQIGSAQRYAAGLMNDGSLYVWGTNRLTPSRLAMPRGVFAFRSVSVTETNIYALDQGNTIWQGGVEGWLSGSTGIALKTAANSFAYSPTNGSAIWSLGDRFQAVDFAMGNLSFYSIQSDGRLLAWYRTAFDPALFTAEGVTAWLRVFASANYVLAIDDRGRLFEWQKGFLTANSSTVGRQVSFPPGVTNFIDVAVTTTIAIALTDKGELYAWGTAAPGVWNDPTARVAFLPERVWGLPNLLDPNAKEVAASFTSTSATSTEVTFKLASPAGLPVTIETSDDLMHWNVYMNFTASGNMTTVTLPIDATSGKFFRIAP